MWNDASGREGHRRVWKVHAIPQRLGLDAWNEAPDMEARQLRGRVPTAHELALVTIEHHPP